MTKKFLCCASLKRNFLAQIFEHKHTFILRETDSDVFESILLIIHLFIVHFPLSLKKKAPLFNNAYFENILPMNKAVFEFKYRFDI